MVFKHIYGIAFLAAILIITSCAGLGNMKEVRFENTIEPDMTMVNIVRRNAYLGDGTKVEAWDGDNFIGTLRAGKLLQYKTKPGSHTFMVYMDGLDWGVAKGDLKPGKTYYLKFNIAGWGGPIILGAAKSDDPRIGEWKTMTTVAIDELSPKKIPEKYLINARKILKSVDEGNAKVTKITDINAL